MTILLQQVRLLDPLRGGDRRADVLLANGKIQAVAAQILDWPAETHLQDCQGCVLGPGLVDLYSHSGEPGYESRETLASLAQAAIAGGFTRLTLLPDTQPVLDHPGGLERFAELSAAWPLRVQSWGALTQGLRGEQMTELAELAAAGVVGFSDGRPLSDLALLRRSLEYLQPLNYPIALWPCHRSLAGAGVMREGMDALRFGLPGIPAIAETAALAALLELVAVIPTPIHIMRVSTARSVELLAAAKTKGLPITASTPWMHLLLDTTDLASYNPHLHLAPPLGQPKDRQALVQGIKSGVIDAIAIDHTALTYEEKTVAFAEAPPGAIGLELALPLLWEQLVATQTLTALELWRALSTGPAHCLGQNAVEMIPGQALELALFDPQKQWTVGAETLHSLSRNTPWLGETLTGRVLETWYQPCSEALPSPATDPKT
jgi:dihydroorotase